MRRGVAHPITYKGRSATFAMPGWYADESGERSYRHGIRSRTGSSTA
jgi:hypothetical protein